MAAGIFNKAVGSLRLLIFAPLLGTAGFGALRLAVSASHIISSLSGLGLFTSYIRYIPELSSGRIAESFFKRTLTISLAVSCVGAAAMLCFPQRGAELIFSDPEYSLLFILLALSVPVIVLYKSFIGASHGYALFRMAAIGEGLQNIIYLGPGALAIYLLSGRPEGAYAAFIVGMIVAVAWLFPAFRFFSASGSVQNGLKNLILRSIKYSMWYALIPLFSYLFDFIDKWMLAHFYDLGAAGSYSIIPVLAGGMFIIGTSMTSVVARKGAELIGKNSQWGAQRLVWSGIRLVLIGSLLYSCAMRLIEPIVWSIASPGWSRAASVMPVFLSYFTFYNLYYLLGCFASFKEQTWIHLVALSCGAVVNTSLNFWWVPVFGMEGAALGTFFGLLTAVVIIVLYINRRAIFVPRTFWLILALASAPMLYRSMLWLITMILLLISWKTDIFLKSHDRRLISVTIAGILKGKR